eukprot:CAMPEP_0202040568 /NCGR_PEP_ID=MMETSP0962-20130828/21181_1 /ASSEMBLY_ACC=CAM_ASM_000488 /TAXON_ID=4773 /ORGANISM="Schizochytrium aggregatum, Strain ATCC28209" /LENGTH=33 /DNA_ID= /DNA_START= /DNA_END= /DNA_ORIENTATION=
MSRETTSSSAPSMGEYDLEAWLASLVASLSSMV